MALGGSRADVARLVIGQGMGVAGLGIIAGLALALMTTRFMSSLLFGVGTLDPSAYTSAGALLFGVALVACAVPAFRAMRLQPASGAEKRVSTVVVVAAGRCCFSGPLVLALAASGHPDILAAGPAGTG